MGVRIHHINTRLLMIQDRGQVLCHPLRLLPRPVADQERPHDVCDQREYLHLLLCPDIGPPALIEPHRPLERAATADCALEHSVNALGFQDHPCAALLGQFGDIPDI